MIDFLMLSYLDSARSKKNPKSQFCNKSNCRLLAVASPPRTKKKKKLGLQISSAFRCRLLIINIYGKFLPKLSELKSNCRLLAVALPRTLKSPGYKLHVNAIYQC